MIDINDLKYNKNNEEYNEGYRIVYFYEDGSYSVGEYCKTIEGFMVGFAPSPIMDESEIPPFVSNEDLLNRCLEYDKNAVGAAIYNVDGELIDKIDSKINKEF